MGSDVHWRPWVAGAAAGAGVGAGGVGGAAAGGAGGAGGPGIVYLEKASVLAAQLVKRSSSILKVMSSIPTVVVF